MKTKTPLVAALYCGLSAISSAFTLNFVGHEGTTLPPNPLVIPVPGYGHVQFDALPGSTLEVNNAHMNDDGSAAPSLSFNMNEAVKITFHGLQPINVNFDYVGVSPGEYFIAQPDLVTPQSFIVSLNGTGNGAGLYAVSWNQIPEPSSALLGALAGGFMILRRRR
jgi:hypothetical protein